MQLPGNCRWIVLGLLGTLPNLAAAAPAEDAAAGAAQEPREISVGCTADNYPFSFVDSSGRLQGFSVDVLYAVARAMNFRVRRVVGSGSDLSARFASGQLDCLQLYGQSEERNAYADFSVPYFSLEGCIFVKAGGPAHNYADLDGRPFAVVGLHGMAQAFLRDQHLNCPIVDASSPEEALRRVMSGECAGTFLSRLTAVSVIQHASLKGIVMLGQPMTNYEVRQSFALHKGDSRLLAQLNEGLAIISRDGEYTSIYQKWFGWIDSPLVTRDAVIFSGTGILGLAFVLSLWAYLRQRALRKRVAGQAAELRTQRALLHALYENIPLGLSVIELADDGPLLTSINRAAAHLYGLDPERSIDRRLADLPVSPAVRSHLEDVLRRRPQESQIIHYDYPFESERRVLEVTIVPLGPGSEEGGNPHFCVLAEDVSARKLMDAEIAQSRRLRAVGELVGGIAHEFNNLLTPVMLKVGEIQMDWGQDPRLQQEMGAIAQATKRAAELTRRLLTFGRKTENRAEPVRLAGAVANCFDLLRHTVDRRIVWESSVPDDLPPILFNATDLNQVLLNLLLNARDTLLDKLSEPDDPDWTPLIRLTVEALPPGAAETAKARSDSVLGWQRVTVRDNGRGMPSAVVERVFEPFFTTKDVGKGTGLGLATVWHIVTEAGGRIDVDSTPGAGSAFHILLPERRINRDAPGAKPEVAKAAPARPVRVLLVEDEDLVAEAVTAMLQRGGHQVHRIADGAKACEHLSGDLSRYELLVVDVNLPGMNGVDLVARLRKLQFPGRIFVVSGRIGMAELRTLVQLHVDRVLTKPFSLEQFEAAVRECLAADAPAPAGL